MAYALREEQETWYNFSPLNGHWQVFSTYPPHIKRILEVATITNEITDDEGRTIQVDGYVDLNQVRMFNPR